MTGVITGVDLLHTVRDMMARAKSGEESKMSAGTYISNGDVLPYAWDCDLLHLRQSERIVHKLRRTSFLPVNY